ncbi:TonB-dependent receptor plug domain-containing protein [Algoriphagus sediminis]|uniref:TonB-dependent receptor plug domain-containing protein n=1 Tax=Algoriphagus sediminis TaxID=3057113 RepID=A0ABT7YEK4_9BACT|nr:TonB-dependent receptor plug domain-containing protein [Algoriphagus sediminis]MDN3204953.1 TonB-dependent receptor plug domain-containing protein [Algoriphagus sediminis]
MRIKNFYLFALIFLFAASSSFGQTLPEKIQSFFDKYQAEFPVEKVYLHLDKDTYTLGEDVWFSAYVTAGSSQIPTPLSKPLYVDLFDGNGLLLKSSLVRLEQGRGAGNFTLPLFGNAGEYQIKAYTSWMKNFGKEYFFSRGLSVVDGAGGSFLPQVDFKEISVIGKQVSYSVEVIAVDKEGNPLSDQELELKAVAEDNELHTQPVLLNDQGQATLTFRIPGEAYPSQYLELTYLEGGTYPVTQRVALPYSLTFADIQFLPESGHWLVGKKSQMAFRAVYPDGNPAIIEGQIVDQADVKFRANFAGLGKFEMTPESKNYVAEVKEINTGETVTVSLPQPDDSGLTMQVVNNPSASYLTAFVQGIGDFNDLLLVSQTRGIVNYMIQGQLNNGIWGVRIPKENLITGINQITILTGEGTPLLERLVFFMGDDQLDLDLAVNGDLGKRSKIELTLNSKTNEIAAPGTFSLSVLDAGQVELDELSENIFSSLLLSSDLRGGLYSPGAYFNDNNEADLEAIDLVMLTHGWTRFSWDEILKMEYPKIENFIERGINIEGQVTDSEDTRRGLSGGTVNAIIGGGIEILSTEYGPNGRFMLRDMDYLDSATVNITVEDNRLKNFVDVEVIQPNPTFTEIQGLYPGKIVWPEALTATVQERNLQTQMTQQSEDFVDLEGVTVEGQTVEEEDIQMRKLYGDGDAVVKPADIPSSVTYQNIFQLIQGRVSGVQVFVSGIDVSVNIRGPGSINAGTDPLFLLDNIPVDAQTLLNVSVRDVESVDVFKDPARAAIFGAQGANGVIAVYTKQGYGLASSVGGTLVTKYGGYSTAKEFYQPMYDEDPVRKALDDKRATVYWNPTVETDSSGVASLEYYNTDVASKQILVLEGMDGEGRLGRIIKVIGN